MVNIIKANTMKSGAECIFEILKKVDSRNLAVRHIVLVPDRASLEAERQLLQNLGGSFNVEILTMRRFANRILQKLRYLSKQSAIVALSTLVEDNKDKLSCYTKATDSTGFVENMYETISQLKYCKIKPQRLRDEALPKSVKNKLSDIALLFDGYQQFLEGRYTDSADKLDLLAEAIETDEAVKNSFFYLFDFDNLSAQELTVFEKLALFSKGVTIACCFSDDNYKKYLYLNDIYNGVLSVCKKIGEMPRIVSYNSYTNEFCKHIEDYLFSFKAMKQMECGSFVEIFEGSTRVQEVYALACKIRQHIENGGRFRDVFAITSDLNKYTNAISSIFEEFEIPYFCDRQFCLFDHIFSQFVVDFFAMQKNNLEFLSVLNFAKNHFFCQEDKSVYIFENYCLKFNVSFLSKKSTSFTLGVNEPDLFNGAESVRKKLMEVVNEVPLKAVDSARSFVDSARRLCEVAKLVEKNTEFCNAQKDNDLAFESKVTEQVAEKFFDVLQQIEDILGDRQMSLEAFLKVLRSTLSAVNISAIPLFSDCVVFANMAKARKHDIKFLALLGANQGQMPILKSDCKLLNDSNIEQLNKCGIFLEPQISIENKRERFSLFQLLCEPTQKLYVSYTATDGKDSLLPSSFVSQLQQIFVRQAKPLSTEKPDESLYTVNQTISKLVLNKRRKLDNQPVKMPAFEEFSKLFEDALQELQYTRDFQNLRVTNGRQLFLKNQQTSPSRVTDFFSCPYKFFLKHGLGVSKRQEASIESKDLGTILHKVLDKYVSAFKKSETEDETRQLAKMYFDEQLKKDFWQGVATDPSMKNILNQLREEAEKVCLVAKEHLQNSSFENLATEFGFGSKNGTNNVEVDFSGGKLLLTGIIDRIDYFDGKFFVIDYKSGSASFSESELYLGKKLQLLIYLKAVEANFHHLKAMNEEITKLTPVGFYYSQLHNQFVEEKNKKPYVYFGRTIDDVDIAKQIDKNLKNGTASQRIGLALTKDGEFNSNYGKRLSQSQIEGEIDYAIALVARAAELMAEGFIAATPYQGSCQFCEFSSICDFLEIHQCDAREIGGSIAPDFFEKSTTEEATSEDEALVASTKAKEKDND